MELFLKILFTLISFFKSNNIKLKIKKDNNTNLKFFRINKIFSLAANLVIYIIKTITPPKNTKTNTYNIHLVNIIDRKSLNIIE